MTLVGDPVAEDSEQARCGGSALIGGTAAWPTDERGRELVLTFSLPAADLVGLGLELPTDSWVSVFTLYDPADYVLDHITYHGDPRELVELRRGGTAVLMHPRGAPVPGTVTMPARRLRTEAFGGEIGLLQNEPLDVPEVFVLRVPGSAFPFPDLLCFSDAVGYLFLDHEHGLWFAQVT